MASIHHQGVASSLASSSYSGYISNVFPEKLEQQKEVCKKVRESGFIPEVFVSAEVSWFYTNLGIDDLYFQLEDVESIARHIISLYGAKVLSYAKGDETLSINLECEGADNAVYINSSDPGVTMETGPFHEKLVDEKYLDNSSPSSAYRLESYRSADTGDSGYSLRIRSYFIRKCNFATVDPKPDEFNDIKKVGDTYFLEKATSTTLNMYSSLMKKALERTGPVIQATPVVDSTVRRLAIAYKQGTAKGFFNSLSDLYHYYKLYSLRKYVEQFSNGVTIICLYLDRIPNSTSAISVSAAIYQIIREVSLIYCIPSTPLNTFFNQGIMSAQEVRYAHVCWIFAQHFLNKLGNEYRALYKMIDRDNPAQVEVLQSIKNRLRTDSFTPEFILDTIKLYPELISLLYMNFAVEHYITPTPRTGESYISPTLSYQRMESIPVMQESMLLKEIRRKVSNSQEQQIFEALLTFNKHVLKTNFYQPTKVALSFRLDTAFLPEAEYPQRPYGIFLIVGNEFRGFHVRFEDVGRGGIRLIRSRNREAYNINLRNLFEENYNLALTQNRKNKDIPEGGSKGTVLLEFDQQHRASVAFEKYIDAILDLIIVGKSPGIKETIVDKYGKLEMLFFGPDEGTADYMDLVSLHGCKREAPYWRSLSTGKSQSLGGIPHDIYGMTTRSIRQFVQGIFEKFNIKEEECTKIQTGGPDGDLGSNEILISSDKTIGIVDGSGVLYDPEGINRDDIVRLAKKREPISGFNTKLLSTRGFRVLVDETDVTLPDGTIVESGLHFRNSFHLTKWATADLFVPCGGRPEAVDATTVGRLLHKDGTPKFRFIVEGANLFFTQEARIFLENLGVVMFKDASTNKGGVTSSSLEVLSALVFTNSEYEVNMCVKDGKIPEFYTKYVDAIYKMISYNARREFEAIWREHAVSKIPRCTITDMLSQSIIKLTAELSCSKFWSNKVFVEKVFREYIPSILIDTIGLDVIIERLPENYSRALFAAHLASKFVYQEGPNPKTLALMDFLHSYYSD